MCNEDYVKCNAQHGRCTNRISFVPDDGYANVDKRREASSGTSRVKMRMREREVGWRGVRVADV